MLFRAQTSIPNEAVFWRHRHSGPLFWADDKPTHRLLEKQGKKPKKKKTKKNPEQLYLVPVSNKVKNQGILRKLTYNRLRIW